LAFLLCSVFGILVFKVARLSKRVKLLIHFILMTAATGFMIATVYIRRKKRGGIYYSIHSWTGLAISALFGVEWLLGIGLIEKLFPNLGSFGISRILSAPFLEKLKRIHVNLGKFFVLSIAFVSIIGIERINMGNYSAWKSETALQINVTHPNYKKLEPYYLSTNAWGIGKQKHTCMFYQNLYIIFKALTAVGLSATYVMTSNWKIKEIEKKTTDAEISMMSS